MKTVKNSLFERVTQQHAKPSDGESELMGMHPVEIMGKSDFIELKDGNVAYMFRLNHLSDEYWHELFVAECVDTPAEIHGMQLEIRCKANDLEKHFKHAKAAIQSTNKQYQQLRAQVHEHVANETTKREQEAHVERTDKQQRTHALREQFEQLEI